MLSAADLLKYAWTFWVATLLKKRLRINYFLGYFAKFIKTLFLRNISGQLLLSIQNNSLNSDVVLTSMDHCNNFARDRFTVTQIAFGKLSSNREFFNIHFNFLVFWMELVRYFECVWGKITVYDDKKFFTKIIRYEELKTNMNSKKQ